VEIVLAFSGTGWKPRGGAYALVAVNATACDSGCRCGGGCAGLRLGCGAFAISSSLSLSEALSLTPCRFPFPGSFVGMSLVGTSSSLISEFDKSSTCSCVRTRLGAGFFGEDFDFGVDLEDSPSFLLALDFDMGTPFLCMPMVGLGFSTFLGALVGRIIVAVNEFLTQLCYSWNILRS
jgi:hypothetical protein